MATGDDALVLLDRAYRDRWHIWRQGLEWYATRRGRPLSTDQMYIGLAHTLVKNSGEELEAALKAQAELLERYEFEQQQTSRK